MYYPVHYRAHRKIITVVTTQGTNLSLASYIVRRTIKSFWGLPVVAMVIAIALIVIFVTIDRSGASEFLASQGRPFDMSADAATELNGNLIGIIVALMALFISITLVALTIAAGNLGIRLIDRWINRGVIRVTLSMFVGMLTYAILLQVVIDPDAISMHVPRWSLLLMVTMTIVFLPWLCFAFDSLSRAIHIDTSIQKIGADLARNLDAVPHHDDATKNHSKGQGQRTFNADSHGYIENINATALCDLGREHDIFIDILCPIGGFVNERDALFTLYGDTPARPEEPNEPEELIKKIRAAIIISSYRTGQQGHSYQSRLLTEIAVRALSPSINDIYTAHACIDQIVAAYINFYSQNGITGYFADSDDQPRIWIARSDKINVFHAELQILRRNCASHPSAMVRIVDGLHDMLQVSAPDDVRKYLTEQITLCKKQYDGDWDEVTSSRFYNV